MSDIDRLERVWIFISAGILALLAAAVVYAAFGLDIHVPSGMDVVNARELNSTPPFDQPGLYPDGPPGHYRAVMVAHAFAFEPKEMRVPSGSTVHFVMTSKDVIHGFRIPNTTVNLKVVPGHVIETTHRFTKPGTYHFFCHEYCGAGHHVMGGELIVEPNS